MYICTTPNHVFVLWPAVSLLASQLSSAPHYDAMLRLHTSCHMSVRASSNISTFNTVMLGKTTPTLKVKHFPSESAGLELTLTTVAAVKFFDVRIQEVSSDGNLRGGQMVTIKITAVVYSKGVPYIIGELASARQVRSVNGDNLVV